MSRREKREEKKGISLVGFLVILVALVCVEGIYIVKLKGTNVTENNDVEISKNTTSTVVDNDNKAENKTNNDKEVLNTNSFNYRIISSIGYNPNIMIDSILENVEHQADAGSIIKMVDGMVSEDVITAQNILEKKEDYRVVIMNNLDSEAIINSVKFEKGKLTCEYNIKGLLNLIGLESKSYADLGANENNIVIYNFN